MAVRLAEEEIPTGVERVDLEFEIVERVAGGIEEDLEVVVAEDDGIVLGERRPDVRLFEFGGDVEVAVVPEHLGAGAKAGRGVAGALNVDEVVGPGGVLPGRVVQVAVDADGAGGAVAGVVERRLRECEGGEEEDQDEAHEWAELPF